MTHKNTTTKGWYGLNRDFFQYTKCINKTDYSDWKLSENCLS